MSAAHTPETATDWKDAANRLCAAMLDQAPSQVQKIADTLYGTLLDTVQDYLRENVDYNLSAELMRAKRDEAEANRALQTVAIAMGVDTYGFPNYPLPAMIADLCVERYRKATTAVEPNSVGTPQGVNQK